MSDVVFSVFYAWQSDSPANTNRDFVESAIDAALKRITTAGTIQVSPRLDKDTKDVSGIPDIAATILEKIRSADVFVADISYVARLPRGGNGSEKAIPNPNVMIELGYALAELGANRIVYVLNTHSGRPDELPFDLRNRRWPIVYGLPPDADVTACTSQGDHLTTELQKAIEPIAKLPPRKKGMSIEHRVTLLEDTIAGIGDSYVTHSVLEDIVGETKDASAIVQKASRGPRTRGERLRETLINRINAGQFQKVLPDQPSVVLTIYPISASKELPLFHQAHERTLITGLRPLYTSEWDHEVHGERFVTLLKRGEIVQAATEIDIKGVIRAVDCGLIKTLRKASGGRIPENILVIPSVTFEKGLIEGIERYLYTSVQLGGTGPWVISLGLIGLRRSVLGVSPLSPDGRTLETGRILPPPIELSLDTNQTDPQVVARAIRSAFDYIWREYGYPRSLNYGETGDWLGG